MSSATTSLRGAELYFFESEREPQGYRLSRTH